MTDPSAPPLPAELDALVRPPYLRKAAPDVVATASAQMWGSAEVLRVLLAGFDSVMPKTLATATVDWLLHHATQC